MEENESYREASKYKKMCKGSSSNAWIETWEEKVQKQIRDRSDGEEIYLISKFEWKMYICN